MQSRTCSLSSINLVSLWVRLPHVFIRSKVCLATSGPQIRHWLAHHVSFSKRDPTMAEFNIPVGQSQETPASPRADWAEWMDETTPLETTSCARGGMNSPTQSWICWNDRTTFCCMTTITLILFFRQQGLKRPASNTRVSQVKSTERQLLPLFPNCLEEATRTWPKTCLSKSLAQRAATLDCTAMEKNRISRLLLVEPLVAHHLHPSIVVSMLQADEIFLS